MRSPVAVHRAVLVVDITKPASRDPSDCVVIRRELWRALQKAISAASKSRPPERKPCRNDPPHQPQPGGEAIMSNTMSPISGHHRAWRVMLSELPIGEPEPAIRLSGDSLKRLPPARSSTRRRIQGSDLAMSPSLSLSLLHACLLSLFLARLEYAEQKNAVLAWLAGTGELRRYNRVTAAAEAGRLTDWPSAGMPLDGCIPPVHEVGRSARIAADWQWTRCRVRRPTVRGLRSGHQSRLPGSAARPAVLRSRRQEAAWLLPAAGQGRWYAQEFWRELRRLADQSRGDGSVSLYSASAGRRRCSRAAGIDTVIFGGKHHRHLHMAKESSSPRGHSQPVVSREGRSASSRDRELIPRGRDQRLTASTSERIRTRVWAT